MIFMAEPIAFPRRATFGEAEYSKLERSVLEALPHAVITTDLDGRVTFWNRAAEKLYGWRATEVMGRSILEVTPTADSATEATAIMASLKLGEKWAGEFQVRHRDGHWFLANVINTPVHDAHGTRIGIMGISQPAAPSFGAGAGRLLASSLSTIRETLGFPADRRQAFDLRDLAIGVALFCVALLARYGLDSIAPSRFAYVTFYPAAVLAAFFCGPFVGIFILILCSAAGMWWVLPTPGSDEIAFRLSSALAFIVSSGLSVILIFYLRALQRRLEIRDKQLALVNRELKHRLQNVLTIASSISLQTVQSDLHAARRAMQQPRPERGLQALHGGRDARLGQPELLRGPGEAAQLGHAQVDRHRVEEAATARLFTVRELCAHRSAVYPARIAQ
jgi:PAS domain S-box-containing protein